MNAMQSETHAGLTWNKQISEQRDRLQSMILTWTTGLLLLAGALPCLVFAFAPGHALSGPCRRALAISVVFGILVRLLRAATVPAALVGSSICLLVTAFTGSPGRSVFASGLSPLMGLFLLTFAATRFARWRGVRSDPSEVRKGRRASQVVANLGWAGLVVLLPFFAHLPTHDAGVLLIAVLAEATADTCSSEIGQAAGGVPRMLGTGHRVAPGTDGAVSVAGTFAGVVGAMIIGAVGLAAMQLSLRSVACAVVAAVGGLLFDSVLGATLERRGWLGNDLVNFLSNGFSGLMALALLRITV